MHYRKLLSIIALAVFCGNAAFADEPNNAEQQVPRLSLPGLNAPPPPEQPIPAEELQKAADAGDAKMQGELARSYFNGTNGFAVDYEKGVFWAQKAADQGDANGQNILGICYEDGLGVPKNPEKGFALVLKAAEQGLARAQVNLIIHYLYEEGGAASLEAAEKWTEILEEQGDPDWISVAHSLWGNWGLSAYGKESQVSNPKIQYAIGLHCAEMNPERAMLWIELAAQRGLLNAQLFLAECYSELGEDEKVVYWYRKAADQGNAVAQTLLGSCYARGDGVEQDDREAARWYRKAADQGFASAQTFLGLFYANGLGVEQDDREAARWFRKAADQGFAGAQYFLGLCYLNGTGVEKDVDAGMKWLKTAAENGSEQAEKALTEIQKGDDDE